MPQCNQNDFEWLYGNPLKFKLTVTDVNGQAIDLTGWTVWLTLKTSKSVADVDATINMTIDPETLATGNDLSTGVAVFGMSGDQSKITGLYYYSVMASDGVNEPFRYYEGVIDFLSSARLGNE